MHRKSYFSILALLISLSLFFCPPLRAESLSQAISEGIDRVEAFAYIRRQAEKMGVRVWMFGGTAFGFAHYARLASEASSDRKAFFDYDFSSIFSSRQDIDLVIEGSTRQAVELERQLRERFPRLTTRNSRWEVRPLRERRDAKDPLLGNSDFLKQHNDSGSIGMIEITRPPNGEPLIRDLREWDSQAPDFLSDISKKQLTFYFSPDHDKSLRVRKGLNPPIISVIRYLSKIFQYDLTIPAPSMAHIRKIIADFHKSELRRSYVAFWMNNNAHKLLTRAFDKEKACKVLEELGLRDILLKSGRPKEENDYAWWASRQPLPSYPLSTRQLPGAESGKTAAELGISRLIMNWDSDLYESLTRSPDRRVMEFADPRSQSLRMHLDNGDETSLSLPFHLEGNAREGFDFTRDRDIFVFNRNAVRFDPERLIFKPADFFNAISRGTFDTIDLNTVDKMRRLSQANHPLGPSDWEKIEAIVMQSLQRIPEGERRDRLVLLSWLGLSSGHHAIDGKILPALLQKHIESRPAEPQYSPAGYLPFIGPRISDLDIERTLLLRYLNSPKWAQYPGIADLLMQLLPRTKWTERLLDEILSLPSWLNHKEADKIARFLMRDLKSNTDAVRFLDDNHDKMSLSPETQRQWDAFLARRHRSLWSMCLGPLKSLFRH